MNSKETGLFTIGSPSAQQIEFLMEIHENQILKRAATSITATRHSKLLIRLGLLSVQLKKINDKQIMIYAITAKGIEFLNSI